MRYVVVNADDFGASPGVNRGIVESHRGGIVTSTSLMTEMPASQEAPRLARECPSLSVGLHVSLPDIEWKSDDADLPAPAAVRGALEAQLRRFVELLGRPPTHLDSHHHIHTHPFLLPHFEELASRCAIPLRDCSGVRYCSSFYGQWDGESRPEEVSVAALIRILDTETADGVVELGCHPGRPDPDLTSSYSAERELELWALCDERVRTFVEREAIALVGFDEARSLIGLPARGMR
jgi:chitin disaccharide deacetylase